MIILLRITARFAMLVNSICTKKRRCIPILSVSCVRDASRLARRGNSNRYRTRQTTICHLRRYHKSDLYANGIYLQCNCGDKMRSEHSSVTHGRKCKDHQFTLRKLDS
ncbi:hypothetical protein PENTCL1PPCAC_24717, partial [Pristionchus entomophagus]